MASAAPSVLRGRRGGSYRLLGRIAVGGMSEVFEAEAEGGARVVVKVMLPHLAKAKDARSAFAHEAELGRRLRDDHLVSVLDDGEDGGAPFLVLERVDGASLLDLIVIARLPLSAVLVVAADLLSALSHLHGAADESGAPLGIVHRDLSPDNALVDRRGRVKLVDLGIARSRLRGQRTQTGIVRGKAAYLSPEQITGSDVDARADLYSLGAVLFEAATGERHAKGETDIEILRSAENPTFVPPSTRGADPRLDGLLRRALGQYPEDRFPSAAAMRREVTSLLGALGGGAEEEGRRALSEAVERAAPPAERVPVAETTSAAERAPVLEAPSGENAPIEGKMPVEGKALVAGRAAHGRARSWAPLLAGGALLASMLWIGARFLGVESASPPSSSVPSSNDASLAGPASSASAAPGSISPTGLFSAETSAAEPSNPGTSQAVPLPASSVAPFHASSPSASTLVSSNTISSIPSVSASVSATPVLGAVPSSAAVSSVSAPAPSDAPADKREAVQRRIAVVSAALRNAKSKGQDVSALEDRAAIALQAFLDGRYDDTNRELDAISARIPK